MYTVTSKNLLLKSLLFLFKTSSEVDYFINAAIAIGSEENIMAFYPKSETDSYYFSLAIWNSITKEYPKNAVCSSNLDIHGTGYNIVFIN